MAAFIVKTLAREACWTWLSTIISRFNIWTVEIVQEAETDPAKKVKIKRIEGKQRINLLSGSTAYLERTYDVQEITSQTKNIT